jgi:DNA-binding beta-propeller fold protein YncE
MQTMRTGCKLSRLLVLPALLSFPALDMAQDAPEVANFRGPVLGYVFQPGSGLRLLRGLPGAAVASAPAPLEGLVELAAAPRGGYAVAILGESRQVALLRNLAAPATPEMLPDLPAGAVSLTLSPSGSAAVVAYGGDTPYAAVVAGLPAEPHVAWWFPTVTGAARAVSDSGEAVLSVLPGEEGSLTLDTAAQTGVRLAAGSGLKAAFLPRSTDAVVLDAGLKTLTRIQDVAGRAESALLAGEQDGLTSPVDVAATLDGGLVLVANADPAAVAVISLTGAPAATLALPCTPAGLLRLQGGNVFQLTGPEASPLWALETGGEQPRVFFIPVEGGDQQ